MSNSFGSPIFEALHAPKATSKFKIQVRYMSSLSKRDSDDYDFFGEAAVCNCHYVFYITAKNEEAALDIFHATIPISSLEDFEIGIARAK